MSGTQRCNKDIRIENDKHGSLFKISSLWSRRRVLNG